MNLYKIIDSVNNEIYIVASSLENAIKFFKSPCEFAVIKKIELIDVNIIIEK